MGRTGPRSRRRPPPSPGSAAAPARSRHRQIRRRRLRPDRPRLDPPDVEEEGGARGRSGLPGHATAGSAAGASTGAAPAWICPPAPGSARWRRGRRSLRRIRPPRPRHRRIRRRGLRQGRRRLDLPGGEGEGGARGRSGLPSCATAGPTAVHAWIRGRRPRSTPGSASVHTGALAWIRGRDAAPPRASSRRPPPVEGGGEGGGGPPVEGGRGGEEGRKRDAVPRARGPRGVVATAG